MRRFQLLNLACRAGVGKSLCPPGMGWMVVDHQAKANKICGGDVIAKIVTSADNNKLAWSMHHE